MAQVQSSDLEQRILLLAPTSKDAVAAKKIFPDAGMECFLCTSLEGLCGEIQRGGSVAIVPEEVILADRSMRLAGVLKNQPSWSDFPIIVLTSAATESTTAISALQAIGPTILVRRPVDVRAFVSTINSARRDRMRQYLRRELLAEQERQAEALRENDRKKDEFIAMLSHELRNPLAAVSNAVSVLKKSKEPENVNFAKDIIDRQVGQLSRLIEDLLDASRIATGKVRLRCELIDLRVILDRAIESARPLLDQRRHEFVVANHPGELIIDADPARIEQIIVNILANAAKYTEEGGRITLRTVREGSEVMISVKDNGMGIAAEKLPSVFQLFAQGERSIERSEGGLGIGLTIVRRLAEMHGGNVVAKSDGPGKGSEFVIRLPLSAHVPAGDKSPTEKSKSLRGAKIMVVDDNVDTAQGMGQLLKILGNEVELAHDGRTAIDLAKKFKPDFILLDIGLPEVNGYEVVRQLRQCDECANSKIIAVSGYGQDEDRRKSLDAGFNEHLVKPVDFDRLFDLIGTAQ